eukprot:gene1515-1649_t
MSIGYENVPVTKILTFTFLLFTLFSSDHSASFSLDILRCYYEIWRVLTSFLVYDNLAQSLVTLILLFNLSTFEMQMGSRKYATFLVFVWIVSLLLEVAVGVLAELVMAVRFVPASGPYLLVFAPLALYYKFVPKIQSSQFKVFGMEVSYKSWIYLLSAQLMFNSGLPSVVSSLSALVAGLLYAGDHFGCQKWRLPRWLELPFRLIGRILSFLTPSFPTNAMQGGNRQQGRLFGRAEGGDNDDDDRRILNMPASSSNYAASQLRNRGRGQGGLLDEPLPPDENAIAALVNMGFGRPEVIQALRSTGNNVEAAANMLLRLE